MILGSGPLPSEGAVRHFFEPEEVSSALLGGQFDYLRVAKARYAARLGILRVGDLVIQHVVDGPHLARGAMAKGIMGVVVPLRYAGSPARMNGVTVPTAAAFLAPGGVEIHGHCPGDATWASLGVPNATLEAWTDGVPPPCKAGAAASVARLHAEHAARLTGALNAVGEMVEHLPAALAAPDCAQSLADSLRELVASTLLSGCFAEQPRIGTRDAYRIVRRADEFLLANVSRPIYREELCAALGASMRKVHGAFVTVVGMSPHRYLRLRRLSLVRQQLQAASVSSALVKSIALSHGFWHLGRFAHDYRELFGESPSETRRLGRTDADRRATSATGT